MRRKGYGLGLEMFVVYDNPRDAPGKFVVRRWVGERPDAEPVGIAQTLEEARCLVPDGLENIGRMPNDDQAIREVRL